jgi:hypothetical protein
MNLLRWNNAQGPQGKSAEPTASHRVQGLGAKKTFLHFRSREKFFLDIPFIRLAA